MFRSSSSAFGITCTAYGRSIRFTGDLVTLTDAVAKKSGDASRTSIVVWIVSIRTTKSRHSPAASRCGR